MTSTLPPFYIVDLDKNNPSSFLHFFESPIIPLHYGFTGTPVGPTDNAGIRIERGTLSDVQLIWDETNDFFEMGIVGSEVRIAAIEDSPDNYAIPYWVTNISDSTRSRLETDSTLLSVDSLTGSICVGTSSSNSQLTVKGSASNYDTSIFDATGIGMSAMYKELSMNGRGRAWYMGAGYVSSNETSRFVLLGSDTGSGNKPYCHLGYDSLLDKLYIGGGIYQSTNNTNYLQANSGFGIINPESNVHVFGTSTTQGQLIVNGDIIVLPTYEFPPIALSANTTTISGQQYGNGTYICTASSVDSTNDPWKAFDKLSNTTSTYWNSSTTAYTGYDLSPGNTNKTVYGGSTDYPGEWIQIQLPATTIFILKTFSIQAVNFTNPQAPYSFAMFGSNNGTTWTILGDYSSEYFTNNQVKRYSISNTTNYTYYRLGINKRNNSTGGQVNIGELRLYGYITTSLTIPTLNGNVGIGTSSPSCKLQIGSGNGDYQAIRLGGGNSSGFIYGAYESLSDGINIGYNYYAKDTYNGSTWDKVNVFTAGGANSRIRLGYGIISFHTSAPSVAPDNTDSNTALFINVNRNIGINTITPTSGAVLDVNSTTSGIKVPVLTYSNKTSLTSNALVCYDSTFNSLSYNIGSGTSNWKGTRSVMSMMYNNNTAYSAFSLTSTGTAIIAPTSNNQIIGDSDFTTVAISSINYFGIKYNSPTPPTTTVFKLTFNFTFSVSAALSLRIGILKNATSGSFISGGQRVLTCAASTFYTISIVALVTGVSSNDYFILGALTSTSGTTITIGTATFNDAVAIVETTL